MVAKQNIKLGHRHAGKLVTVVIEDTHLHVLHGEEELAVRPAATSTRSPAYTSPAPASATVKHELRTISQGCSETSH
jgi:hypothetical protein